MEQTKTEDFACQTDIQVESGLTCQPHKELVTDVPQLPQRLPEPTPLSTGTKQVQANKISIALENSNFY